MNKKFRKILVSLAPIAIGIFVTIEQGRNVHQWKKVKNKFI